MPDDTYEFDPWELGTGLREGVVEVTRYINKSYWKLPCRLGELQYGHVSRSIVLWWRGKRHIIKRGDLRAMSISDLTTTDNNEE